MSEPFIGEIRMFAGNFAPQGWLLCDGSVQSIAEYDVLYALIGTRYGGDGQTTFNLPDLRGRAPIHQGQGPGLRNYIIGETGGQETVTLTVNQIAAHGFPTTNDVRTHIIPSAGSALAQGGAYAATSNTGTRSVGGSQPHENMGPFLAINYIIAVFGVFPARQ